MQNYCDLHCVNLAIYFGITRPCSTSKIIMQFVLFGSIFLVENHSKSTSMSFS